MASSAFWMPSGVRSARSARSSPDAKPWSAEGSDQLLEGDHLIALRGRRYDDERLHSGLAPRGDAVAHLRGRTEQRDVAQPALGQGGAHRVVVAARDRGADRAHLVFVSGLDPVVLVVGQLDVTRERA